MHNRAVTVLFWIGSIWLGTILCTASSLADNFAIKPAAPVNVELAPLSAVVVGEPVEFRVQAESQLSAQDFSIEVALPEGVELRAGEIAWRGKLTAGEQRQLIFSVVFSGATNTKLVATAVLSAANGEQFAAQQEYAAPWVGRTLTQQKAQSKIQPKETMRNGMPVVEYTVQ